MRKRVTSICRHGTLRSACAFAQSHLFCPQTESLNTKECFKREQMSGWGFAHGQDDVSPHILCVLEGTVLLDAAHMIKLSGPVGLLSSYITCENRGPIKALLGGMKYVMLFLSLSLINRLNLTKSFDFVLSPPPRPPIPCFYFITIAGDCCFYEGRYRPPHTSIKYILFLVFVFLWDCWARALHMKIEFERLMFKYLFNHLTRDNNLLSSLQSGFIPGDSTVNQLTFLYNTFCQALDSGKEVRAVFCDISKAFDRAWHAGLLLKLKTAGVAGSVLTWFKSYLSDIRQRVVLPGAN